MNTENSVAAHAPFSYAMRVRYHEADLQGIVFHGRYVEYFDVAMTEFLRQLGWDYGRLVGAGCDLVVVKTTIEFLLPALADQQITVTVRPAHVGRSSLSLAFVVERAQDNTPLCQALTVYVNWDHAAKGSRSLPAELKAQLQDLLVEGAGVNPN